jgi:predicted phage tail protein
MHLLNRFRRGAYTALAATTVVLATASTGRADAGTGAVPDLAPTVSTGQLSAAPTRPTAPRSPRATPANRSVKLTWRAPLRTGGARIDKYAVQRSRTGTSRSRLIGSPKRTTFTATGLRNGVRFYFRVRAHNAVGWGTYSRTVKAVPRSKPSAPRSATVSPGNASVTLAWLAPYRDGGAKIDKYAVQRGPGAGGPWTNVGYPTSRSFTAGGLANGTGYSFRIRAHNAAGWGPASAVVDSVPRTVPTAPQWPSVTPGDASATVYWLEPSSTGGATIDKYVVERAPGANGPWTNLVTTSSRNHTATGLTNGTTYYFRVAAHNTAGWGPYGTVVNAVPRTVPTAPQSLAASAGKNWIHLTWDPSQSDGGALIQGYLVQRATSPGGPWTAVVDTSTLSYTANGLPAGTAYYYRVLAHNAVGWSTPTSAVYANVPTLPSQPATCTAKQLYGKGSHWVHVEWTAPSNNGGAPILKYAVRITNLAWNVVYASGSAVGNATSTDLPMAPDVGADEQNGKYYYAVHLTAENAAGVGPECGLWVTMEP